MLLIYLVILLNFLPKFNLYWTTFETLAETAKKDNSAWEIGILGAIE